ncbi:MAG: hypothetical protein QOG61_2485 [Candidatus Binataceae bacterium]|nr:hypothetical protein [Candidatus Binataceae bacterium]
MESNRAAVSMRYHKNVRHTTLAGECAHVPTYPGRKRATVCVMVQPTWIQLLST